MAALGGLIRGKQTVSVVNVGPGMAWKHTAKHLPLGGRTRRGFRGIKDVLVKYLDRAARRTLHSRGRFVTFEPFELAEMIERELGLNSQFKITVVDNKPAVGTAIENSPANVKFRGKINFVRADIRREKLPAGGDVVFALSVLHYAELQAALENLVGGLGKGGILVTNELKPEELSRFGLKRLKKCGYASLYLKAG